MLNVQPFRPLWKSGSLRFCMLYKNAARFQKTEPPATRHQFDLSTAAAHRDDVLAVHPFLAPGEGVNKKRRLAAGHLRQASTG
jgi:hypothetical protein